VGRLLGVTAKNIVDIAIAGSHILVRAAVKAKLCLYSSEHYAMAKNGGEKRERFM
jgi:hypothetical protein